MTDKLKVYFGHDLVNRDSGVLCYVFNDVYHRCYSFFNPANRAGTMEKLKQKYREGRLEFSDKLPDFLSLGERERIGPLEGKVLEDIKSEITGIHL